MIAALGLLLGLFLTAVWNHFQPSGLPPMSMGDKLGVGTFLVGLALNIVMDIILIGDR